MLFAQCFITLIVHSLWKYVTFFLLSIMSTVINVSQTVLSLIILCYSRKKYG
jgi:hypothetical protein